MAEELKLVVLNKEYFDYQCLSYVKAFLVSFGQGCFNWKSPTEKKDLPNTSFHADNSQAKR